MRKGQLQLEAIICFAVFLAILGIFLNSINQMSEEAGKASSAMEARAEAEQCCMIADSVYSNGLLGIYRTGTKCNSKGNIIESKEKRCTAIAREIRLAQAGNESFLEVELNAHYR